ncbi:MAG: FAD-binding oxidoreductase [Alphaproteobacteria bacterium]|nr:FAD-binding oxidoreductase [Alphaproteobacteria bacterium]
MGLDWFGRHNRARTNGERVTRDTTRLLADLAEILPPDGLVTSDRALKVHETDGYVAQKGRAAAIARPRSTRQVRDVMRLCHLHGAPVVPRGSGTSQVGGVVPEDGAILISMARMKSVLEFDRNKGLIRVQAGITNLKVSKYAVRAGWFHAPNPSSRRTCTIGGNIATNSSGSSFLRYGGTADNLVAAHLVLDDGESIELSGDDPALALICGSEGQMGLVTEAQLRLHRIPESRMALVAGFATVRAALAFSQSALAQSDSLSALDLMDKRAVRLTEAFRPSDYPLGAEAIILAELSGPAASVDHQTNALASLAGRHDMITCRTSTDIQAIWSGRNAVYGAIGQRNNFLSLDCAVPLSQLQQQIEQSKLVAKDHALEVATVIHCGDGTVHSFLLFDPNDPDERSRADRCAVLIRSKAAGNGGSVSSEYGIGLRNRKALALQYSARSLKQQTDIVEAFSKERTLNPGKCFPEWMRGAS